MLNFKSLYQARSALLNFYTLYQAIEGLSKRLNALPGGGAPCKAFKHFIRPLIEW